MRIDPNQAAQHLRLVRPPEQTQPTPHTPAAPKSTDAPASSSNSSDKLSFEAVYQSKLPRMPWTEAQQRVDRIRRDLVGGKVDVPIHFQQPGSKPSNPYAAGYLSQQPDAASRNEQATQRPDRPDSDSPPGPGSQ